MDTPNPHPGRAKRLRKLLGEAGLTPLPAADERCRLPFLGRTREWYVVVRLSDQWLNAYTVICQLPKEAALRSRVLEAVTALNGSLPLGKFALSGTELYMEIDYRAEHVDAGSMREIAHLLYELAENSYPQIFRIVSGDETLAQLEGGLRLPEAAR